MPGINASTMAKPPSTILKGVVAFVDVWSTSKRENFSDGFITQLTEMGAKVSKTLNKHVTHVIFKHGHQSTWRKAEKMGLKLVSVLWVDRCKNEGQHIEESLCPALNEESKSVLVNKRTHKCMQPRDAPARTPENDKRLKKKLEKMMEKMVPSSPVVPTWSPLIIDEENGIIYSPSLRRAEAMAERLREMREQRENLSPTASQMVESMRHEGSLKPAIGSTPPSSSSFLQMLEEESDDDSSASRLGLSTTPDAGAQLSGGAAEGGQQQLLCLSASRSDYSGLGLSLSSSSSSIAPSQEKKKKNPHTHSHTRKLLASTPLSGTTPKGSSAAAATSMTSSGSKAPSSSNRKGRSKTPAKRRSTKQNSLDSYFSPTLPKDIQHTVMVNDTFSSDGETSSRKSSVHEGELKLTPPGDDWGVVEETPLRGSPNFTETRTKTDSLVSETWTEMIDGGNAKRTSTSPVLPVIRKAVKDRTLSCPEAAGQPTKAPSAVSALKKISKCSTRRSPAENGGNDEDGAFEDYFSSSEKPSSRRKTFCLDFLPENDLFSPFEQTVKPFKRKRRKSGSEETTSKRHRHAPVKAADVLADTTSALDGPPDKDEPCSSSKLKRTQRRKPVGKQQQQRSTSGGKGRQRAKAAAADDDDDGGGVDDGDEERVVEQEGEGLPSRPKAPTPADLKRERLALTVFASPMSSRVGITRGRKGTQTLGSGSKNAPEGLRDSSAEMFSCQGGAKDKNVKSKRTLVMTSMPTEKQHTVLQVVKSLGGFSVVDAVCETTTHVVAGSPRRTLNILLGIARGCWVVSYEWILWCLEHRQWIPEEPYELSDHFPAAPICRLQQHLSAGEHQQDLFQGLPPMFVSPLVQPPRPSLQELIALCGGAVCQSVRQAGIFIGEYRGRKPEGARSLSEQWILDCVTHLKRLPFEDYNLEYQCP